MAGIKHFKTRKDYQKWLAFGHIKGVFEATPGTQKVYIGGKLHKVKHKKRRR